jgi:hypothetical protein
VCVALMTTIVSVEPLSIFFVFVSTSPSLNFRRDRLASLTRHESGKKLSQQAGREWSRGRRYDRNQDSIWDGHRQYSGWDYAHVEHK